MVEAIEEAVEVARAVNLRILRERIAAHIREHGPIPAVRVSAAKSSRWAYWSVVRYEVRLGKRNRICARALGCAKRDRRSVELADRDAEQIAADIGGVVLVASTGELKEGDVKRVGMWLDRKENDGGNEA